MNHTEIGPITDAITSVKRGRLPRSLRVLFHRPKDVHQESVWANMSMELLTNVARFLSTEDQQAMHLVCKQWQHAVQEACGHLVVKKWNAQRLALFQGLRELTLSDMAITASMVQELCTFRKITGLNLVNCTIEKQANVLGVPHALSELTSLTLKHLRGVNELHLEILIGELPQLRRLHLHTEAPKRPSEYDEPESTLPVCAMPGLTVLSRITGLQSLELHSGTPRESLLPGLRHLSALGALRHLHLVGVGVNNEVFNACPLLPRLQHLALPNATDLTDPGMLCLNPCTQLTYLDVGCTTAGHGTSLITNASALALRNMRQLRHLNLSGSSRLSHQGALYLSNQHPHLTYLNLNNTAVSNSDDDFLTRFANLEHLVLSRTDFCSEQLQGLFTLSKLRVLDLSHLFITDDIAKRFLVLSELTELNVSHCRDLTNTGALGILRACPKMQTLVVTGCPLSTLGMLRLHRTRRNLQTWAITDRMQEEDNPHWLHLCQNVLFIHAGTVYKLRAFQVSESNMFLSGVVSVVVCVVIVGHWLVLAVAILLLCLLFSPLLLVMLISALISAVVDFVGRLLRLMHRALLGGPAQAAVGAAHGGDEVVDDGDMWEVVPV